VRAVVARAEERFGPVDLFCSNAGVGLGGGIGPQEGGPFAPDADWRRSFDVNLMAHVYAARAVLPSMLARGRGALLQTASAAGLLTDLGTAAYAVTKHAAVAFAEWLAIRYGDAGIHVACLCPMGVRTDMVAQAQAAGAAAHLLPGLLEPEDVAEAVVRGLAEETFLILPHAEVAEFERRRSADRDRWLAGMRRFRKNLYPGS
jgi:NAD(P)-dependent dehydrogenase (short-subunit alcohol dehydrogenase family)